MKLGDIVKPTNWNDAAHKEYGLGIIIEHECGFGNHGSSTWSNVWFWNTNEKFSFYDNQLEKVSEKSV